MTTDPLGRMHQITERIHAIRRAIGPIVAALNECGDLAIAALADDSGEAQFEALQKIATLRRQVIDESELAGLVEADTEYARIHALAWDDRE